jgi:hypothetical protein
MRILLTQNTDADEMTNFYFIPLLSVRSVIPC